MLYIATSYLPVLRASPVAERARSLVTVLPYYSPWALAGVVIMAVTGPFSATVSLAPWEPLPSTPYGRGLGAKILPVRGLLPTPPPPSSPPPPRLSQHHHTTPPP